LPNCLAHQSKITLIPIKGITILQNNEMDAISTTSFYQIVNNINNHYGKVEQFALSLYEINTALAKEDDKKPNIHTIVPPKYHDYLKIFEKANANKLPLHYPSNHTTLLIDRFKPPFGTLYLLSYPELEELKYWLDENLSKGFTHILLSPAATPILFVKKGDGLL
jgi:DNA replication protein DnaD